jgi:methyltransferase-like protein 6
VAACLAPRGVVCVRDYAAGDLAEERLDAKHQKLGENFYARGDSTRAYYFTRDTLCAVFAAAGMVPRTCAVQEREIVNRAKALSMERRWIQATFELATAAAGASDAPADAWPCEADGVTALGGELGGLLQGVVGEDALRCRSEPHVVPVAGRELTLQLLSREWQHTERATGSMLWEGARALAEHLHASSVMAGAVTVELGAGASALPSLAASLSGAGRTIATDGHEQVLSLLRSNLAAAQPQSGAVEALQLRWGSAADEAEVLRHLEPSRSLLLLGADVVYDSAALPLLFSTVRRLLCGAAGGHLLLCHVSGRGGQTEEALARTAAEQGVRLAPIELAESAAALLRSAALAPCVLLRGDLF